MAWRNSCAMPLPDAISFDLSAQVEDSQNTTAVRIPSEPTTATEPSAASSNQTTVNAISSANLKTVTEMTDEELLERWKKFVDDVERGYKLGLDDYRNDLDIRSEIAAAGLAAKAQADDQRLKRMLGATKVKVWDSDVPHAFWVQGYPRNASGTLREDLEAEDLAG